MDDGSGTCERKMLLKILLSESHAASKMAIELGYMLAGTNGAYGHFETPVRNTSHWLVSFCNAYKWTGDSIFARAAMSCLDYVLSAAGLFKGSVTCRIAAGKDTSNGVLGQAQIIEALWAAWEILGNEGARSVALSLAERTPFDSKNACWNRLTPTGGVQPPDFTFNHQLYFAAVLAKLAKDSPTLGGYVDAFLLGMDYSLRLERSGVICHSIIDRSSYFRRFKQTLLIRAKELTPAMKRRQLHYQSYNLYAYALLVMNGAVLPQSAQRKWSHAGEFLRSQMFEGLLKAPWGNPLSSGTETICADVAFYRSIFSPTDCAEDVERSVKFLEFHRGPKGDYRLFTADPETQKARIYRYWFVVNAASS